MKTFLGILFFFLLITQICFAQGSVQSSHSVDDLGPTLWIQKKWNHQTKHPSIVLDVNGNLYVTGMSGGDIVAT